MGFLDFLRGRRERSEPAADAGTIGASDTLLEALSGKETISERQAMQIPAFAACVNMICDICSMIPIRLYRRNGESIEQVDDPRVSLVNDDTRDTLTGADFKRAMVYDYLTGKGGYAYINRRGKHWYSLNYVRKEQVSFVANTNPIFKDYKILVNGQQYEGFQFLKLLRHTRDGYEGISLIRENELPLLEAYNTVVFANREVKHGGMKRGFLQSEHKLAQQAVDGLKNAYRRLYSNSEDAENTVILNDGIKFQDAGQTAVEMQLVDLRTQQAKDICKIFGMPESILMGNASDDDWKSLLEYTIAPIMDVFQEALNRDCLQEREKKSLFWEYDMSELTKADIKTRYEAYDIALKSGWMQMDEVRRAENMPSLGVPFVKLNLSDVLYDPESGIIFTPNTGTKGTIADAPDSTVPDPEGKPEPEEKPPDPEGDEGQQDPEGDKKDEDQTAG